ncbi:MAG TPA: EscU/YscU/HrcU family type III secretion system export apparatus switch protein [Candidatus Wallbacteria bacterium]|nr:EscU/YscU/HrcU family type III secretion system export apparatus switch protein [Candidatus Wallbacteria bacterium]
MDKKEKNRAVALTYDHGVDGAPKIAARGEGFIAEQIIKIAKQYDVPFYRDADLCEVLVQMDVNTQIPEELYEVLAKVLAFVYKANRSRNLLGPGAAKK